ncbi:hypothetical protein J6590_045265 [Homalodisca vitripennis]|nr:hypothetical protein J6590_045265 [Homalodisca vitripennis]
MQLPAMSAPSLYNRQPEASQSWTKNTGNAGLGPVPSTPVLGSVPVRSHSGFNKYLYSFYVNPVRANSLMVEGGLSVDYSKEIKLIQAKVISCVMKSSSTGVLLLHSCVMKSSGTGVLLLHSCVMKSSGTGVLLLHSCIMKSSGTGVLLLHSCCSVCVSICSEIATPEFARHRLCGNVRECVESKCCSSFGVIALSIESFLLSHPHDNVSVSVALIAPRGMMGRVRRVSSVAYMSPT